MCPRLRHVDSVGAADRSNEAFIIGHQNTKRSRAADHKRPSRLPLSFGCKWLRLSLVRDGKKQPHRPARAIALARLTDRSLPIRIDLRVDLRIGLAVARQ